jgi:hypothetical protein
MASPSASRNPRSPERATAAFDQQHSATGMAQYYAPAPESSSRRYNLLSCPCVHVLIHFLQVFEWWPSRCPYERHVRLASALANVFTACRQLLLRPVPFLILRCRANATVNARIQQQTSTRPLPTSPRPPGTTPPGPPPQTYLHLPSFHEIPSNFQVPRE